MEIIIITKTTSVIHRDLFVESRMITVQLVSQLCDFVFFLDSLVLNKGICCQNSIKFFVFSWFVILHFSFVFFSFSHSIGNRQHQHRPNQDRENVPCSKQSNRYGRLLTKRKREREKLSGNSMSCGRQFFSFCKFPLPSEKQNLNCHFHFCSQSHTYQQREKSFRFLRIFKYLKQNT